jgi:hypothetical protein
MRYNTYLCACLFTLLSAKCFAQSDVFPVDDSASKKIFFSMDYRNGFIRSDEAHVVGFRGGVEIGQKYRLGVGYHYLSSEVIRTIPVNTENTTINTNARVHLRYGSISGEYILFTSELWQISAPLILGAGASFYEPPSNKYSETKGKFTFVVEPAVTIQYNIIPFIGIGTGIGYRFMPIGDSNLRPVFATPVYDVRLKLLLNEVSEALFPNGLWKKKHHE